LSSETTTANKPAYDPTSVDYQYPHPANRYEERESFKIFRDIAPYVKQEPPKKELFVTITFDEERNLSVDCKDGLSYATYVSTHDGGVYTIDQETGEIFINEEMLPGIISEMKPNIDGKGSVFIIVIHKDDESIEFTDENVYIAMPFGFEKVGPVINDKGEVIYILQRWYAKLEGE
jgi:hypothetical protein